MSRAEKDVKIRIEKAATLTLNVEKEGVQESNLSRRTKVKVFQAKFMSVLLYGAETWSVIQQDIGRLKMFQMRCLWDIVGVTLYDMRHKADILEETGELPIKEELRLKRLQWFRHLQRDARPSATEATAAMQTKRKEE